MRSKTLFLIFISIIILITIFYLAIFQLLPDSELIRLSVQDKLGQLTGKKILIGSLKLTSSISEVITLNLEKIALISDDGKEVASIEQLRLTPSLKELLNREICINSATVTGLRARVERSAEGTITDIFGKVMVSPDRPVISFKTEERIEAKSAPPPHLAKIESAPANGQLKWSVRSLIFTDCRLDWLDHQTSPEEMISLTSIAGKLIQHASGEPIFVSLKSRLSGSFDKTSLISVEGQILPSIDFSNLERLALSFNVEKAPITIFRSYLPKWTGSASEVNLLGKMDWKKDHNVKFSVATELLADTGTSAKIDSEGEYSTNGIPGVPSLRISAQTEALPLKLIAQGPLFGFGLHSEDMIVNTKIYGDFDSEAAWKIQGAAKIQNVVPAGILNGLRRPLQIDTEFRADPDNLYLDKLDLLESHHVGSIRGKIEKPFSNDRNVNLIITAAVRPQWLTSFGLNLPKAVGLIGDINVEGHVNGRTESPLLDASADITNLDIKWAPHLQKPAGAGAHVFVKGKINPAKPGGHAGFNGEVQLNASGARFRFSEDVPWSQKSSLHFNSKLMFNGKTADLKNSSLVLKTGAAKHETLTGTMNVMGIGLNPKFQGAAVINLNSDNLAALGLDTSGRMVMKGSSNLKCDFGGDPNQLNWNLELPLTNLGLAVGQIFRKSAGAPGRIKASGKLSKKNLFLTSSELTLPGVSLFADGELNQGNLDLSKAKIELKKSDTKDVSRLLPILDGYKFSGPIEASFHLGAGEKGFEPSGTIHLLSLQVDQNKSAAGFEQVNGNIQVRGTSLSGDLTGKIRGILEAPIKAKLSLNEISSLDDLFGRLSLQIGPGRFRTEQLKSVLNQARILMETILNPETQEKKRDILEFESLTGDFEIKSRIAQTQNLRLKGNGFSSGAIGGLRLDNSLIDAIAGVHTVTAAGAAIGKIPGVQDFVKKHEDLLKMTGLDKELKRFGIQTTIGAEAGLDRNTQAKTPVTVILKIKGSAKSPEVVPMLEPAVNKDTLSRLKSLLH